MTIKSRVQRFLARSPIGYRAARRSWRTLRRLLPTDAVAFWDRSARQTDTPPRSWLDYPFVEDEYIRPLVSGDRAIYFVEHFVRTHLNGTPVERGLSLGCGSGDLERSLLELDAVRHLDAIDHSPRSIALARRAAQEANVADRIHYQVADVETLNLSDRRYSFVGCKMSLHHFENLEHILPQLAETLRPDGVLMLNEFVGPTRHQWTDDQLDRANQLLDQLPRSLRRQIAPDGFERHTEAEMIAMDPSESIRSAEIIPLLERWFEIIELKPYGGTLLQFLVPAVLPLLDLEAAADRKLIRSWFEAEREEIESGRLASDYVYLVARPWAEPKGAATRSAPG